MQTITFERGTRFYEDDVIWVVFGLLVITVIATIMYPAQNVIMTIFIISVMASMVMKKLNWPITGIFVAMFIPTVPSIVVGMVIYTIKAVQ